MNRVCVVGSLNIDMVMKVQELPKLGETLKVSNLDKIPGGKGGNQACSTARLGSQVTMIGAIGQDEYGVLLQEGLEKDGIDTTYLKKVDEPTGMAIITVDRVGNNTIAVISGANQQVLPCDIHEADQAIRDADVIISQFETPIETTIEAFKLGKETDSITLLNPAPYEDVSKELLAYTDIIIPNETETYELTGIVVTDEASGARASQHLLDQGVKYVIITMGKAGAILASKERCELVEGYKVDAIDTTAAGDSFIGAMGSKINQQTLDDYDELATLIKYGNLVASITVTRAGAQSSIPTLIEVEAIGRQQET